MDLPTASDPTDAALGAHRVELALEAGRMGTWYWDARTDRLDWDDQLLRVFGVPDGGFSGTLAAYVDLLHPDDVERTVATVQESLQTGRDHYVEHRVVHPDGSLHWISGTGRVLRDEAGSVVGMVGVGADITEQRAQREARQAAEAATAIAQDAAVQAQSRLALLGRISGVLGGSLDVTTTLQQIAHLVVRERLADWCVVQVPGGPTGLTQPALAHRDPEMVAMARRLQDDYPPRLREDAGLGKVLRTGKPELWPSIPDELLEASAEDATHLEILRGLRMTSAMIIPLPGRAGVLGAVTMIGSDGRTFDPEDLAVAVEVGVRAGVALDNATLYADRDTVARTLQASLLPAALPDVPGAEVVALHKPGRTALGVGGDFYDGVALGEDGWLLAVGDVCGKGVEAAALTGAVRYAVRTAAILAESPAQVLRIVNDALLREDWTGRFATLVLARLDRTSAGFRLTVSAAGHPAPLVRRTGGTVEGVDVEGTLVGLLTEAQFGETVVDLADGDCVLLFTDGLTEAGAPGEMFGDERLAAALAAADPSSAERVTRDVLARVEAFATGTRSAERDDMAVLAVRVG